MRLRPMQSRKAIMNEPAPVRNYFPVKSVLRGAKVKESIFRLSPFGDEEGCPCRNLKVNLAHGEVRCG